MGLLCLGYGLWRTLCDDCTAALSALGTEIDNVVDRFYHVGIVLDDNHGVAGVYQAMEHDEQTRDVGKVQSRSWLVE